MSAVISLFGTDIDDSKAYLIVISHIAYRSTVLTGKRWLAILKKNRGMSDCFRKRSPSYGDWMKVNILVIDNEKSI
jgi:hypothetical protein